jgi:hypothetical protein
VNHLGQPWLTDQGIIIIAEAAFGFRTFVHYAGLHLKFENITVYSSFCPHLPLHWQVM